MSYIAEHPQDWYQQTGKKKSTFFKEQNEVSPHFSHSILSLLFRKRV